MKYQLKVYLKLVILFFSLFFIFSCSKNTTLSTIEKGIFNNSKIANEKRGLKIVPGDTLRDS